MNLRKNNTVEFNCEGHVEDKKKGIITKIDLVMNDNWYYVLLENGHKLICRDKYLKKVKE